MRSRWFGGAGTLLGGIRVRLIGMILLVALPLIAVRGFSSIERKRDIAAAPRARIARRGGDGTARPSPVKALRTAGSSPKSPDRRILRGLPAKAGKARLGRRLLGHRTGRTRGLPPSRRRRPRPVGPRLLCSRHGEPRVRQISGFFTGRLTGDDQHGDAPVLDANGNVARILAISLRLSWFTRLVCGVSTQSGARVMLYDRRAPCWRYRPPDWVGPELAQKHA
jgi:hypothetical protein